MQSSKVTKVKPWLHQLQFIKWQQSENDTKSCSNSGSGASHGPIIKSKWTIFKAEFVLYETLHLYDISLNYWLDLTCFVSYHFWIFYFYFAWAGITFSCVVACICQVCWSLFLSVCLSLGLLVSSHSPVDCPSLLISLSCLTWCHCSFVPVVPVLLVVWSSLFPPGPWFQWVKTSLQAWLLS